MTTDDLRALTQPDHWMGWLGDDPGAAVRDALEQTLREQVPDAKLLWVRPQDEPHIVQLLENRSRKNAAATRVVCMTRKGGAEDWRKLYRLGVDVMLPKPIHPRVLAGFVRSLIRI